jgi:uncharacterized delta-60 repeat protein
MTYPTIEFTVNFQTPPGSLPYPREDAFSILSQWSTWLTTEKGNAVKTQGGKIILSGKAALDFKELIDQGKLLDVTYTPVSPALSKGYALFGTFYHDTTAIIEYEGGYLTLGTTGSGSVFSITLTKFTSKGVKDVTFGIGGSHIIPHSSGSTQDFAYDLILQPDGKIVIGGSFSPSATYASFIRLNKDLTIDTTFGTDGFVSVDFFGFSTVTGLRLQKDGKIAVVVSAYSADFTENYLALIRLNTNGTLDGTFGTGGKVLVQSIGGSYETLFGNCIEIQRNDKIVVAGFTLASDGSDEYLFAARFNENGSFDTSFATNGVFKYGGVGISNLTLARNLVIQPDDKIIVVGGGDVSGSTGIGATQLLLRLNYDGALDSTFGTGGVLQLDSMNGLLIRSVASAKLQGNKILAWSDNKNAGEPVHIVRYTEIGNIDTTYGPFGTGGFRWILPNRTLYTNLADGMIMTSDGSLIIAGTNSFGGSDTKCFIMKVTPDGFFDPTFGDPK